MANEERLINQGKNLSGLESSACEESSRCFSTEGTFYDTPERRLFLSSARSHEFPQEKIEEVIDFANKHGLVKREAVYRAANETISKYYWMGGLAGGVLAGLAIRNLAESSDADSYLLRGVVSIAGFCMGWMSTGYVAARVGLNSFLKKIRNN